MDTIWKFPIELQRENLVEIDMPQGAVILHVESQRDQPCLWARVETVNVMEARYFCVAGTGHELDSRISAGVHIGTFMMDGGSLVFHLFEVMLLEDD